ncbi:hypothetical protein EDC96DRAFT_492642 [Choanephora cucurbitarum]|nr:hypothetical protein EDC96DRAFT_492642 [Choanephora cucurbitarum]
MRFLEIPNEIISLILAYLPKSSKGKLCLTCVRGYQLFLPFLYQHIEIGHRTQLKQLELGFSNNTYLLRTAQLYTQAITLKCKQGGNSHWLAAWLFGQLPNVRQLYFCDFHALSVCKVRHMLCIMPQLVSLHFEYCDLVATNNAYTKENHQKPTFQIRELSLLWTDFSTEALQQLLSHLPRLDCAVLSANHNRYQFANDASLQILTTVCPDIRKLSISLQQVKENSLCQAIRHYGSQLEHLSIRCQGNETLQAISACTKQLKHLVLRCNNPTGSDSVIHVLQQCQSLIHFEMISWPLHDMPRIVLDQLLVRDGHTMKLPHPSPPALSFLENMKRTVALDKQDLQKIRRLFFY